MSLTWTMKCVSTRNWPRPRKKSEHPLQVKLKDSVSQHQEFSLFGSLSHQFQIAKGYQQLHLLIKSSGPTLLRMKTPATTVVRLAIGPRSVLKHPGTTSMRSTNCTHELWKLILMMRKLVKLHSRKMATPKRRLLLRRDSRSG